MSTRAVVYDLNHTLLDMDPVISWDILLGREFGLELTRDDILPHIGKKPDEFYRDLFGQPLSTKEMRDRLMHYADQHPRGPMPDAARVVQAVRGAGLVTAVFTSTSRELTEGMLVESGLPLSNFNFIHTEEDAASDIVAGNHPIMGVVRRLGEIGIGPSDTLLVGNELSDQENALAGGLQYVVVASDLFPRSRLVQEGVAPDRVIDALAQLPGLLGIEPSAS